MIKNGIGDYLQRQLSLTSNINFSDSLATSNNAKTMKGNLRLLWDYL